MRISDWSSDVCSSDLVPAHLLRDRVELLLRILAHQHVDRALAPVQVGDQETSDEPGGAGDEVAHVLASRDRVADGDRSRLTCKSGGAASLARDLACC